MNKLMFPKPLKPKKATKRKSKPSANKDLKFAKIKVIPLPKFIKKADAVFSLWVRKRDKFTCYASGPKCKGAIQACHLIGRGKQSIRFDETNVNAGCQYHNYIHDKAGYPSPEIYTMFYFKKYGERMYVELFARSLQIKKWTREELEEIIKKYEKNT